METLPDPSDPEYSGTDSPTPSGAQNSASKTNGNSTPVTNGGPTASKKQKLSNGTVIPKQNGIITSSLPPPMRNNMRTQRRKKLKGEKKIYISSHTSLRDFKVQVSGTDLFAC